MDPINKMVPSPSYLPTPLIQTFLTARIRAIPVHYNLRPNPGRPNLPRRHNRLCSLGLHPLHPRGPRRRRRLHPKLPAPALRPDLRRGDWFTSVDCVGGSRDPKVD
jgi:hypothetical protein